jgi:triosephosphate isomerase (TIM)
LKKFLIAANWKMHGSLTFIDDFMSCCEGALAGIQQDILFLPPFVYLDKMRTFFLENCQVKYGAQNMSEHAQGAYTGEISGQMLKDLGCESVLVGHSERRTLFGETNDLVGRKFHYAHALNLIPILCVGETFVERESQQTMATIEAQLSAVFERLRGQHLKNVVIAYEPVWAIGTGHTPTPQEVENIHGKIKNYVAQLREVFIDNIKVLYGGSVTRNNAGAFLSMSHVDGALIGGASLKIEEFLAICEIAQQVSSACNP